MKNIAYRRSRRLLALSAGAQAQSDYPNKPVKIIVNSAPGSATDAATRLMAERLGMVWGQQPVVENRPGAGGSIAVRAACRPRPTATRSMSARRRRSPR